MRFGDYDGSGRGEGGRGSRIGEAEGESGWLAGREIGEGAGGEYNDAARMNMHDKRDRVSLERD